MTTLLWMVLVAAVAAWMLGLGVVRILEPRVHRLARPQERRFAFELIALLPATTASTAALALVLLATSKAMGWVVDHCIVHGTEDHPHLCLTHLPAVSVAWWSWALVAAAAVPIVIKLSRLMGRQARSASYVRMLTRLSEGNGPVRFVDNTTSGAFVAGVWRPRIFFSRPFLNELDHRDRRIVAAHEAAHLRAGDPLRRLLLELCLVFHSGWTAHAIRRGWSQASEECADARVAARFGATETALALLRVLRLTRHRDRGAALGIAGASPLERIAQLQVWDDSEDCTHRLAAIFSIGLLAVASTTLFFHHPIETFLGILLSQ